MLKPNGLACYVPGGLAANLIGGARPLLAWHTAGPNATRVESEFLEVVASRA